MGSLPNLAASFLQRFDINRYGNVVPADGFPPKLDMRPLLPQLTVTLKDISHVGKLNDNGIPEQKWNYELPPMEITALMVQPYHINGVAPVDQFPYSLKAIGLVNANKIAAGGKGLVTDSFAIVP